MQPFTMGLPAVSLMLLMGVCGAATAMHLCYQPLRTGVEQPISQNAL